MVATVHGKSAFDKVGRRQGRELELGGYSDIK